MTAIPAVKAYLVDTLLPAVVPTAAAIYYGLPPDTHEGVVIAVRDAEAEFTQPVYGTTRPIEEEGHIVLTIISYAQGPTSQRAATEAAFAAHTAIRNHFKSSPNENLGGTVRTAGITSAQLLEDDEEVDPELLAVGRQAQINALLSFRARN